MDMKQQPRQDGKSLKECTSVKSPSRLEYCSPIKEALMQQPCYDINNDEDGVGARKDGEEVVCSIEQDDDHDHDAIINDSGKQETVSKSAESKYGISREDIEKHAGKRLRDVANIFGISLSAMKQVCRHHGILRWPVRPINMLSVFRVRKHRHSLYPQVGIDQSNARVEPNSLSLSLERKLKLDSKGEPSLSFSVEGMSLDPKTT